MVENSKGGNVGTYQISSHGKDPRTFEAPVKRWRFQKKRKEKKWKRKKKKKKKQVKHRRSLWWAKRKEQVLSCFVSERKKNNGRKKQRGEQEYQDETISGKICKMAFPLLILMQNSFSVDAAAGRLEPKGKTEVPEFIIVSDAVEGTFVNLDGKSLQEEQKGKYEREWHRSKGVDPNEMRKEEKNLRCALLERSAWSTERKNMKGNKGTFDVFFGIEHRLRKEEM